jgi:hypothetical protein
VKWFQPVARTSSKPHAVIEHLRGRHQAPGSQGVDLRSGNQRPDALGRLGKRVGGTSPLRMSNRPAVASIDQRSGVDRSWRRGPSGAAGALWAQTAQLVPHSTLRVYENAAHGLFVTHANQLNADLLAFAAAHRSCAPATAGA